MAGTWTIEFSPLTLSTVAKALISYYHFLPRFGHSNHVELLVSSNPHLRWQYIGGLISFAVLMLCVFSLWALITSLLRWQGAAKCSCAAGQFTHRNEYHLQRVRIYQRYTRLCFLTFTGLLLLMVGVMVQLAVPKLNVSLLLTSRIIESANIVLARGDKLLLEWINIQQSLSRNMQDITSSCGSVKNTPLFESVNSTIQLRNHLSNFNSMSSGIKNVFFTIANNIWLMKMYALFFVGFVVVLLIIGLLNLYLKTFKPIQRSLYWFCIPMFLVFISFSFVSSIILSSIATANSDFCYVGHGRSPQNTTLSALNIRGFSNNSTVYRSVAYYQSGCMTPSPLEFISTDQKSLSQGRQELQDLLNNSTNPSTLSNVCTVSNFTSFASTTASALNQTDALYMVLGDIMGLTDCLNIYPLIRSFDQVMCQDTAYGISIAAVAFQCITLFGMLMISLRSALYVIEKRLSEDTSPSKKERNQLTNLNCCSPRQLSRHGPDSVVMNGGIEVVLFDKKTHRTHGTDESTGICEAL